MSTGPINTNLSIDVDSLSDLTLEREESLRLETEERFKNRLESILNFMDEYF